MNQRLITMRQLKEHIKIINEYNKLMRQYIQLAEEMAKPKFVIIPKAKKR